MISYISFVVLMNLVALSIERPVASYNYPVPDNPLVLPKRRTTTTSTTSKPEEGGSYNYPQPENPLVLPTKSPLGQEESKKQEEQPGRKTFVIENTEGRLPWCPLQKVDFECKPIVYCKEDEDSDDCIRQDDLPICNDDFEQPGVDCILPCQYDEDGQLEDGQENCRALPPCQGDELEKSCRQKPPCKYDQNGNQLSSTETCKELKYCIEQIALDIRTTLNEKDCRPSPLCSENEYFDILKEKCLPLDSNLPFCSYPEDPEDAPGLTCQRLPVCKNAPDEILGENCRPLPPCVYDNTGNLLQDQTPEDNCQTLPFCEDEQDLFDVRFGNPETRLCRVRPICKDDEVSSSCSQLPNCEYDEEGDLQMPGKNCKELEFCQFFDIRNEGPEAPCRPLPYCNDDSSNGNCRPREPVIEPKDGYNYKVPSNPLIISRPDEELPDCPPEEENGLFDIRTGDLDCRRSSKTLLEKDFEIILDELTDLDPNSEFFEAERSELQALDPSPLPLTTPSTPTTSAAKVFVPTKLCVDLSSEEVEAGVNCVEEPQVIEDFAPLALNERERPSIQGLDFNLATAIFS